MKEIQAVAGSEEYQARLDEIQDTLRDYLENPRSAQSPEELEKLEQEIRDLTEKQAALITARQIQHSLDCEPMQEAQSKLIAEWPHRLKNHDNEGVWVRTANGYEIWVKARYFRRK
ncbi:MAG: HAD-IG family 5'-nucleotidase, partial [bacterium]|nr:HAD-IG family 5'-nucleotidase [bacterium]